MKKFKLFLVGLSLLAFSNFAFAMEKKEQNTIKSKVNKILIKKDKIENFKLTKKEKEKIKNFVYENYDVSNETKKNLVKLIKIEFKYFLKRFLDFETNSQDYVKIIPLFKENDIFIKNILLKITVKCDEYYNLQNKNKKAECLITIKDEIKKNELKLNKKFITKKD